MNRTTCILLVFFIFSQIVYGQLNNQDDYTALRAFYLASDGDNWNFRELCVDPPYFNSEFNEYNTCWPEGGCGEVYDNSWPTKQEFLDNPTIPAGTDMSNWYGISDLGSNSGRVESINFSFIDASNQFQIPADIGLLSEVKEIIFDLHGVEQFTGEIPSQIGDLTNLKTLILTNAGLTGNLPIELGNLSSLIELRIEGHSIAGSIPSSLGNLSNLQILKLNNNQLTGSIPSSLGNLTNLSCLDLSENNLTHNIPSTLTSLSNLNSLALHNNNLSGYMDPSFVNFCPEVAWLSILSGNNLDHTWDDHCFDREAVILALELVNFDGRSENGRNLISWKFLTESNFIKYQLEHSSDLLNWTALKSYELGSSVEQSFSHVTPSRKNYYRIKSFGLNGSTKIHPLIEITSNYSEKNLVTIFPNPATELAVLVNDSKEHIHFMIYDSLGKKIQSLEVGSNSHKDLNLSEWASGIYFINAHGSTSAINTFRLHIAN